MSLWGIPCLGIVAGLLILALVGLLVYLLFKSYKNKAAMLSSQRPQEPWNPTGYQPSAALAILDQRYAKGEIDEAEYKQKKQDILSGSPPQNF